MVLIAMLSLDAFAVQETWIKLPKETETKRVKDSVVIMASAEKDERSHAGRCSAGLAIALSANATRRWERDGAKIVCSPARDKKGNQRGREPARVLGMRGSGLRGMRVRPCHL